MANGVGPSSGVTASFLASLVDWFNLHNDLNIEGNYLNFYLYFPCYRGCINMDRVQEEFIDSITNNNIIDTTFYPIKSKSNLNFNPIIAHALSLSSFG